jgi:alpha/beta superfamily hydrolase
MAEEGVFIPSKGLKLEGLMDNASGEAAVLVTHPHPLYGGGMHNNVVESVVKAYRRQGYCTLRFNFRGVGQSEGSYDQGNGEQEDVRGALEYLYELGKVHIDLAGYSFGAWVNAMGLNNFSHTERMIMISPPVNFMDFSFLDYSPMIRLVITGSEDDFAPSAMIKDMLPVWNREAVFKMIHGADHFYWGKTGEIESTIESFLVHEGIRTKR